MPNWKKNLKAPLEIGFGWWFLPLPLHGLKALLLYISVKFTLTENSVFLC